MKLPKTIADLLRSPKENELGVDGFHVKSSHPLYSEHLVVNHYLEEVVALRKDHPWIWREADFREIPSWQAILDAEPEQQALYVQALTERFVHISRNARNRAFFGRNVPAIKLQSSLKTLSSRLLRRRPHFSSGDLAVLVAELARTPRLVHWEYPLNPLLGQVERVVEAKGLTPELSKSLRKLRRALDDGYSEARQVIRRIEAFLGETDRQLVEPGEPWSDALLADFRQMTSEQRARWIPLFQQAFTASGARPSGKWLDTARKLVDDLGIEEFVHYVTAWFAHLEAQAERPMVERPNALLKGLAWACSLLESEALARALGEAALACFRKIPGYGMRAQKAGNACVYALGAMPGNAPVGELTRIQHKVKYVTAQRLVGEALDRAARTRGLTRADLEELAVPAFGLDAHGCVTERCGDYMGEVSVRSTKSVQLTWINPQGKRLKSVPAPVKRDFPEVLVFLRETQKAIRAALPPQRDRIERLLLREHAWSYNLWRERYLEHPLVAQIARRLIWHFCLGERSGLGIWRDGKLVDVNSQPMSWLASDAQVRLWHPLGFEVDTIMNWRIFLEEHQITQPFKQAHREMYILTDAEVETLVYSNRFAAHILKQHQLSALCRERGWHYSLQGAWDSHNVPMLTLPEAKLKVELWVEPLTEQMSEMGIYLYISTDQVRFYDLDNALLPLTEVPALYFSEIMRDVDLFVGVCSVGNDPEWQDRGEAGVYGDYWHNYSFGYLSNTAQTRKEVLERLLPRLKVSGHCEIRGRFLHVKGQRKTYKIHLGSGNVLMEPNDQYLCIVPDRSANKAGSRLFLPFEGDQTLTLILSKAFLLAEDWKIKDPTIVSQINRHSLPG